MLGFLFKVLVIAGLVAGGGYYVISHGIKIDTNNLASKIDTHAVLGIASQAGQFLDSLVTKNNSPVILGMQVSNQTVSLVTDALMKLPNEQLDQIRKVVCKP